MIELDTEVLVIGSGFGGSVVASRLIDKGVAVVMLERGPWRNTVPVNSMNVRSHADLPRKSFGRMIRNGLMAVHHHLWPRARGFGVNRINGTFEAHFHKGFTSVASSQVGGGSLIWGGLIERPMDSDFWDGVAEGVSEEILAPHFDRVKSELNVVSVDANDLGFAGHLSSALQTNSNFDLTINADLMIAHKLPGKSEGGSPPHGIERRDSQLKESLSFGCLDGSKASTDAIYLGPALAKGLQLLAQCEVKSVQRIESGGYCVHATHTLHKQSIKVHCKTLVMGAGVYNTIRLLMEAQRDGGLHTMPGLGKGIGNNGDEISVLLNAKKGASREGHSGFLTLFNLAGDNSRITHGILNPDFPQPAGKLLRRLLGSVLGSSFLVGMGKDLANGIATLEKKGLQIHYEPRTQETNRIVAEGNRTAAEALGMAAISFSKPVTAHLFGGARVSHEAREGVVNGLGECHQNPGLYIVDAAAIPAAPGAAPSLNIAAWASHVAENALNSGDSKIATSIQTEVGLTIRRARARELAMLFSSLTPAKAAEGPSLVGNWTLKSLKADRGLFNRRFSLLFDEELLLQFSGVESEMEYLKPRSSALDRPVLANGWDGSGLVYQVTSVVKGEFIAMQLRKLPGQEAWLLHSASERGFLGWHLLTR